MGLRDADGGYGAGDEQADLMSARGRSQGSNRLADLVTIFLAPVGSAGLASATILLGLLGFLLVEGGHFQPSTWTSEDQYFVGALSRSGGAGAFWGVAWLVLALIVKPWRAGSRAVWTLVALIVTGAVIGALFSLMVLLVLGRDGDPMAPSTTAASEGLVSASSSMPQ